MHLIMTHHLLLFSAEKSADVFPFFQGLHKLDKKNNLQEIKMSYIEVDDIKFPVQYDIKSKKFSAKLYLKSYKIIN